MKYNHTNSWLKWNPENFPLMAKLMPPETLPPIHAFYAFASGADEIASSTRTSADERRKALRALEDALMTGKPDHAPEFAHPFITMTRTQPFLSSRGRDLLSAFVQDTAKTRYHDYNDWLDYCQRSAAPVGRVLLYLCGEQKADMDAADALCAALQILNHIQNCSDDYVKLDRVYIPLNWFTEAGATVKMLASSESNVKLRRILNRALDSADRLLERARTLPATITSRRIKREITLIYMLAQKFSARLRKRDPLAAHVKVNIFIILSSMAEVLFTL